MNVDKTQRSHKKRVFSLIHKNGGYPSNWWRIFEDRSFPEFDERVREAILKQLVMCKIGDSEIGLKVLESLLSTTMSSTSWVLCAPQITPFKRLVTNCECQICNFSLWYAITNFLIHTVLSVVVEYYMFYHAPMKIMALRFYYICFYSKQGIMHGNYVYVFFVCTVDLR